MNFTVVVKVLNAMYEGFTNGIHTEGGEHVLRMANSTTRKLYRPHQVADEKKQI